MANMEQSLMSSKEYQTSTVFVEKYLKSMYISTWVFSESTEGFEVFELSGSFPPRTTGISDEYYGRTLCKDVTL